MPPAAGDPVAGLRGKLDTCGTPRAVLARLRPEFDRLSDQTGEARVVRILATLADGRRLVRRVHTPARAGMTFRGAVDVVLVPAVVTDRRGRYVTDLVRGRFEIREDGEPRPVSYFSPPSASGLDLVIALDISGSMRDAMPALSGASRP